MNQKSSIEMESVEKSKSLSKLESKENEGTSKEKEKLFQSNIFELNDLNIIKEFKKKNVDSIVNKTIISKSTRIYHNYHISNNNLIEKKDIINEDNESSNSTVKTTDLIFNNYNNDYYINFYKQIKNLIIPKKMIHNKIKDEKDYIIGEIKNIIKKNNNHELRSKTFISCPQISINIKEKISKFESMKNLYNEEIKLLKEHINKNIKNSEQEIIIKGRNIFNINDISHNLMEDINILRNNISSHNNNNIINSNNILPEIISPENMYKIFIYCIKQFDYEERIYKKYVNSDDLITLKNFISKMDKFIKKRISEYKKKLEIKK